MLTYDQISAITQKVFIPKLQDNIFEGNPFLSRLKKNTRKVSGGTSIMTPLMYANTTASGWYTGADALTTTDNEQFTSAEFDWSQAYANITITRSDELKNSGKEAMVNFVKSKVMAAESSLSDIIGNGLYSDGTNSESIQGLRLACAATGTHGGIDKAVETFWQGNVDTTASALSVAMFQDLYGKCSYDSKSPTVALCSQSAYDDLYNDMETDKRYIDADVAKGGFTSLMVNGIPVIVDSKVPAGFVFLINEKYIELVVHKDENFRFDPFVKPTNQNIKVGKVYFMGALTSSNNRSHGMFTSLT